MRIHVIDKNNRHAYTRQLDEHHCLRHDIYIGERRWLALKGVNGREFDQFDLPDAVYILATADDGQVAGGTRLLKSTGPTLLSEVFPYLADVCPFESGPDILEWTRFFVAPGFRESGQLCRTGGLISAAMIAYCLQQGVRKLNAVGETYWLPRISALGWRPKPLGLPKDREGMSICAWTIDVTQHALRTTLSAYSLEEADLLAASQPKALIDQTPSAGVLETIGFAA